MGEFWGELGKACVSALFRLLLRLAFEYPPLGITLTVLVAVVGIGSLWGHAVRWWKHERKLISAQHKIDESSTS